MGQLELKLLGRIDEPSLVPAEAIARIKTFREAVIAGWMHRRVQRMTKATLCEMTGMRPCHVSDYLNPAETDKRGRELRDMPGKYVPAFERACGNSFVSQWLAKQSEVPIDYASIAVSGEVA